MVYAAILLSTLDRLFNSLKPEQSGIDFALDSRYDLLMCMNLSAFNDLPNDQQLIEVISSGIFLLETERYGHSAQLFELYGFYVEVFFQLRSNKVVMIRAFDHPSRLEPYLEAVDISEVV